MSERRHEISFSHAELVALYVALIDRESELDDTQTKVLESVASTLYSQLSVSEMEEIEAYYGALSQRS
jgi:chaperonin GroEL (HSP60 family)